MEVEIFQENGLHERGAGGAWVQGPGHFREHVGDWIVAMRLGWKRLKLLDESYCGMDHL